MLPAGTRFYLTKYANKIMSLAPDDAILSQNMFVAYDVRMGGSTIIPKGTRVVGDWITESATEGVPMSTAQFQAHEIYLQRSAQEILADSDVFQDNTYYNRDELEGSVVVYQCAPVRTRCQIPRRSIQCNCKIKILEDKTPDSQYIVVDTTEVPMTLLEPFIPLGC